MSSIWTIRRSATDAKLSGLCGGVAKHWGVDPVLIRVGCALLALSGGIGLVLYLAGWLLVPVEGKAEAPLHDALSGQARRWSREVWIVIIVISCLVVFTIFGSFTPFGFTPAAILALIWYFGYYKNRRSRREEPLPAPSLGRPPAGGVPAQPQFFSYPGPATPFTQAADAWRSRIEEAQRLAAQPTPDEDLREPVGPASALPPARPLGAAAPPYQSGPYAPSGQYAQSNAYSPTNLYAPSNPYAQANPSAQAGGPFAESVAYSAFLATPDPVGIYADPETAAVSVRTAGRRGASPSAKRLRLVALIVLGLTLSGLGAADAWGMRIPLAAYFAASLLVLGLTLVAAAWLGRARGILPVALLVLLATIFTSIGGPVAQERGWGVHQVSYTSTSQLSAGDHLELGELDVDLTKLAMRTDTTYVGHVDMGTLRVDAPTNVNVVVNWKVKSGAMTLNDEQQAVGSDLSGVAKPGGTDPKKKTLTLDLSVDRGVVEVSR